MIAQPMHHKYTSEVSELQLFTRRHNQMICDLNEGYAVYRPRYIVPDYSVFVENGCEFLQLDPPKDLDELLDGLLILYTHVPSVTSFPVFSFSCNVSKRQYASLTLFIDLMNAKFVDILPILISSP